jgi:tRNA pseudouridine13 synthase
MNVINVPFQELPRAHGGPLGRGRLRVEPEDFQVEEELGFEPDGSGDHRLLWVRKTDANTEWVARRLAELARVRSADVGFAGLKDRRAVTSQWFSLPASKGELPDWSQLAPQGIEVLAVHAHRRKLRRGALKGNRFRIRVRELVPGPGSPPDAWAECLHQRLEAIRHRGVPNYFGEQRFGHGGANLHRADALFRGAPLRPSRHERGIWLSAARSELFNRVLAHRVSRGDWDKPVPGDCLNLAGSHSYFRAESVDGDVLERCDRFDVHPTGPLWGKGDPPTSGDVQVLEGEAAASLPGWGEGLARFGLEQERRPLRVLVLELEATLTSAGLELRFALPAGAYATAVLRELISWDSLDSPSRETD